MSALSPLVGLVTMRAKFPETYNDSRTFAWLVQASVSGRYSSGSDDRINEDVQTIGAAATLDAAISGLQGRLPHLTFTADDFLISRNDEDGRGRMMLMWLSAYRKSAKDWVTGERLHWSEDRHPDVHHVFPKDLLAGIGRDEIADSLANLSFLSAKTNRGFGNDEPETYLTAQLIDRELLVGQEVPIQGDLLRIGNVDAFLAERARSLATAVTALLAELRAPASPSR